MTTEPTIPRKPRKDSKALVRCECEHCGAHNFREPLHYPGGQCSTCGSYALRALVGLAETLDKTQR